MTNPSLDLVDVVVEGGASVFSQRADALIREIAALGGGARIDRGLLSEFRRAEADVQELEYILEAYLEDLRASRSGSPR